MRIRMKSKLFFFIITLHKCSICKYNQIQVSQFSRPSPWPIVIYTFISPFILGIINLYFRYATKHSLVRLHCSCMERSNLKAVRRLSITNINNNIEHWYTCIENIGLLERAVVTGLGLYDINNSNTHQSIECACLGHKSMNVQDICQHTQYVEILTYVYCTKDCIQHRYIIINSLNREKKNNKFRIK